MLVFVADYPGAIVFPAHPTNVYNPAGHGGVPNKPKGWVLHTPEEPADSYPSTPHWFATFHADPKQRGSTHYFVAYTGDIYQCVDESWGAIANGVLNKPYPSWANPNTSLNWQSVSVEIEGYAATMGNTLKRGSVQWKSLLALIRNRADFFGFPCDREHIIGHYQVSSDRSDPGIGFPWKVLIEDLNSGGEDDIMKVHVQEDSWFKGDDGNGRHYDPGVFAVDARAGFSLPKEARMVKYAVYVNAGRMRGLHPDHKWAEEIGFDGGKYGVIEASLNEDGWMAFEVITHTHFHRVISLGYW